MNSYWLDAFFRKSSSVCRNVSRRHFLISLSTFSVSPETHHRFQTAGTDPHTHEAHCPFKTHHWGTSWPDYSEDSLQQIERPELLRDHQIRRSTKHETCKTHRTHQRGAPFVLTTSCGMAAGWGPYTCCGRAVRQLLMSGSST